MDSDQFSSNYYFTKQGHYLVHSIWYLAIIITQCYLFDKKERTKNKQKTLYIIHPNVMLAHILSWRVIKARSPVILFSGVKQYRKFYLLVAVEWVYIFYYLHCVDIKVYEGQVKKIIIFLKSH